MSIWYLGQGSHQCDPDKQVPCPVELIQSQGHVLLAKWREVPRRKNHAGEVAEGIRVGRGSSFGNQRSVAREGVKSWRHLGDSSLGGPGAGGPPECVVETLVVVLRAQVVRTGFEGVQGVTEGLAQVRKAGAGRSCARAGMAGTRAGL